MSEPATLKILSPSQFMPDALTILPEGAVRIRAAVAPGFTYAIEASEDLVVWKELQRVFSNGEQLEFADPDASGAARRFYRLKVLWE